MEKTICAISTPIGVGGISVIRLSGKQSLDIVNKILEKPLNNPEPRKMQLKTIKTKDFCDNCLVVYFKAPFSYTGEDIVEIQCHGGIFITNLILQALLNNGANLAENGEFTKRAFLNGKLSLDKAEGVIDMINAESESQLKAGYNLLKGKLYETIKQKQNVLTDIMAELEVSLDYPEHDIEYTTLENFKQKIENLLSEIVEIKDTSKTGMIIKNGINIALLGTPNVGKSSLMNSLLGFNRAIVTSIAGTTRDIIEEGYVFNGVKVNLIDTAGIRESSNQVEQIGINLAKEKLISADLILFVLDATRKITDEEINLYNSISNKKIIVINKSDIKNECFDLSKLSTNNVKIVETSTILNTNIDKLKQTIFDEIIGNNIVGNSTIITNIRHKNSLEKAENSLKDALKTLNDTQSLELLSIDLANAYSALGEITGETNSENVIDRIFEKFCLGK